MALGRAPAIVRSKVSPLVVGLHSVHSAAAGELRELERRLAELEDRIENVGRRLDVAAGELGEAVDRASR